MKTLYILGAGASRNYDQGVSPVPDLKVPLNYDFFENAKKIIDYYKLAHMLGPIGGLDHFIRNINRLYGYGDSEDDTTSFLDTRLSLEEVMVHFSLEHDILGYNYRYSTVNIRNTTLNELLAYTLAESLSGGPCHKHNKLARMMDSTDFVWNFNYDILMDLALLLQGKFSDTGYNVHFDYVYDNGGWDRPSHAPSEIHMLKLHGSLNWLKCDNCNSLLLLRNIKDVPALWTGIKSLDISCPNCDAGKYNGLNRYIVPPSVKIFSDVEIKYLWKLAYRIRDINRIVSIGYSFSENDPQVKMLLREIVRSKSLPTDLPITVVTHTNDSYKRIKKRLKVIFPNAKYNYNSATDFFTQPS